MGQRSAVRSRHRHAEEESSEHARPRTAADDVLALQRAAGNQAVSALLARAPTDTQPVDAKAPAAQGRRAVLPGIGTIALLSSSLSPSSIGGPGAGGSRPREHERETRDIVLTSRQGRHSAELMRAVREGTQLGTVEIFLGGDVKIQLSGAIVGNYSSAGGNEEHGQIESWTLNFQGMRFVGKDEQERNEGRPDEPRR
jgi:hypothetical protein